MKQEFKRAITVVGLLIAVVVPSASANPVAPPARAPATTDLGQSPIRTTAYRWKPLGRAPVQPGVRHASGSAVTAGHTPQRNVSISVRVMTANGVGRSRSQFAAVASASA